MAFLQSLFMIGDGILAISSCRKGRSRSERTKATFRCDGAQNVIAECTLERPGAVVEKEVSDCQRGQKKIGYRTWLKQREYRSCRSDETKTWTFYKKREVVGN